MNFLNSICDIGKEEELRGTVIHEFTHVYLFYTIGDHKHNDNFYSTMEWLENWFDKNQGLSPRVDKSHDRDQYVGDNGKDNDKENTCPECSYSSPHHSPQCPHNQSQPLPIPTNQPRQKSDTNNNNKTVQFDILKKLLETSRDLATLETAFQDIKKKDVYKENNDNKKILDNLYQQKRDLLQSQNNNHDSLNKGGLGREHWLIVSVVIVGIILVIMIGYLALSGGEENRTSAKPKKKR